MLLFINVISALAAPTAASRGRPLWPLAPGIITLCAGRPVLAARCNRRICECKYTKTRPISDGFRKNNVNYWAFREIRSIIPHL